MRHFGPSLSSSFALNKMVLDPTTYAVMDPNTNASDCLGSKDVDEKGTTRSSEPNLFSLPTPRHPHPRSPPVELVVAIIMTPPPFNIWMNIQIPDCQSSMCQSCVHFAI